MHPNIPETLVLVDFILQIFTGGDGCGVNQENSVALPGPNVGPAINHQSSVNDSAATYRAGWTTGQISFYAKRDSKGKKTETLWEKTDGDPGENHPDVIGL